MLLSSLVNLIWNNDEKINTTGLINMFLKLTKIFCCGSGGLCSNHRHLLEKIAYESKQIRQIERANFFSHVWRLLKCQEPIF